MCVESSRKAIAAGNDEEGLHLILGAGFFYLRQFDEAEDAYRMGLRLLAPATAGAADLRLKLTELYLDAGRIDDAKREVARVDRIIQTNSAAQRYQSKLDSLKQRIPSQP